jgi:TRAP-type C4-dicarboxylate transport system permease small subunit
MRNFFTRADNYLAAFSRFFLVFLVLLLTGMMATSVFLRYVLGLALPAIEELSILVGLWLYFLSMVYVTRERGHLTGGVLDLFNLSRSTRAFVKAFNDLIGLAVICIFGFYAVKYFFFVMKINRVSTNLGWPTAIWVSAAIVGFILMALYKLRDLFIHDNSYTVYDNKSPHSDDAVLEEVTK